MQKEELDLIKQVQQGDLDSFTPLYESYFKRVYSFLLLKADGNISLAEDATATTFIKVFENINKFSTEKEGSSFIARIYNIAYHSLIDLTRGKSYEQIDEENDVSQAPSYIDYFQKHVQVEQILAYLEEMGSDKKDLFILRIRDNLSYDEIAKVMGKRSSTCRKDFSKLVKKVANHFKYWIED